MTFLAPLAAALEFGWNGIRSFLTALRTRETAQTAGIMLFVILFVGASIIILAEVAKHIGAGELEHDRFEQQIRDDMRNLFVHNQEGDDAETAKRLTHEHTQP